MTSIAVVTAWQNHLELASAYFEAVETGKPDQLVIVDDASIPPLEFASHRLDSPTGFCGANNVGLAAVETDAVLMLNNDVVMTRPNWLDEIRGLLEPGVIVAPLRFDPHGSVDGVEYPYADGWCLAAMTDDLRAIGGWNVKYDEAGPAYFSDNALTFQAVLAQYTVRELRPGLRHIGGQTGGVDRHRFETALAANRLLFEQEVRSHIVNGPDGITYTRKAAA